MPRPAHERSRAGAGVALGRRARTLRVRRSTASTGLHRARSSAGDHDWLAKPAHESDSQTAAWFELHEHLLATLGRDRSTETAAPDAPTANGGAQMGPSVRVAGHRALVTPFDDAVATSTPDAAADLAAAGLVEHGSGDGLVARRHHRREPRCSPSPEEDEEIWSRPCATPCRRARSSPGAGVNSTREARSSETRCAGGGRWRRRRPSVAHARRQPAGPGRTRAALPGRRRVHRPAGYAIYDIPGRTGRKVATEPILRLARPRAPTSSG
ncbi:MAG: hypothetical protein U5R31_12315 [Acidimicrobiia bacterium]|nr:hypothetical protein [Acidimicrobiia bacterium]